MPGTTAQLDGRYVVHVTRFPALLISVVAMYRYGSFELARPEPSLSEIVIVGVYAQMHLVVEIAVSTGDVER